MSEVVGALVFAANEGAAIAGTIAGLAWAREVVVVDACAADDTCSLAARAGARVVTGGDLEVGLAAIECPWVLLVGGAEAVPEDLAARIARAATGAPRPYRISSCLEFRGARVRLPGSVRLAPRAGLRVRVGPGLLPELAPAGRPRRLPGMLVARPYADLRGAVERLDVLSSAAARLLARQRREWGGFVHLALRPPATALRLMARVRPRSPLVPAIMVVVIEAYRVTATVAKAWEERQAAGRTRGAPVPGPAMGVPR